MSKTCNQNRGRPAPLFGLFLIALAAFLSVVARADTPPVPTPLQDLQTEVLTISDKSPGYNFIFVGERRMRVSTTARILNAINSPIPLEALPTPCKARITYRLFGDQRDPMVEKITLMK